MLAATAFCLGYRYLPAGEEGNKVEATNNISIVFYLDWLGLELLFSDTIGKIKPLRCYIFMSLFRRSLDQQLNVLGSHIRQQEGNISTDKKWKSGKRFISWSR